MNYDLFDGSCTWRRTIQTDPNFANFRYGPDADEIALLDFGAARHFYPERIEAFRALITATLDEDRNAVEAAAIAVGYFAPEDDPEYRQAIVEMVTTAAEPARAQDAYDFGLEDLSERLSQQVIALRVEQGFGRLPPPDVLYPHRKLGGLYQLCKRLHARVRVADLVAFHLTTDH